MLGTSNTTTKPSKGRHDRETEGAESQARCVGGYDNPGDCGWSRFDGSYCPRHFSAWYAKVPGGAKHRKAGAAL